jgi:hypothetical protein
LKPEISLKAVLAPFWDHLDSNLHLLTLSLLLLLGFLAQIQGPDELGAIAKTHPQLEARLLELLLDGLYLVPMTVEGLTHALLDLLKKASRLYSTISA